VPSLRAFQIKRLAFFAKIPHREEQARIAMERRHPARRRSIGWLDANNFGAQIREYSPSDFALLVALIDDPYSTERPLKTRAHCHACLGFRRFSAQSLRLAAPANV
jgi:hypothetical protein